MNVLHKLAAGLAAVGLTLGGFIAAAQPALAEPSLLDDQSWLQLSDAEEAHLALFWTRNGVEQSVQDELFEGIANGEWPQAITGQTEPVQSRVTHRNGNVETTEIWEDGSIAVSVVQQSPGVFNPFSLGYETIEQLDDASLGATPRGSGMENCRVSSGSGYRNFTDCAVYGTSGPVVEGFIASYSLIQGAYDKILRHSGPYQSCAGATCDTPYLGIEYLTEQYGRKAQVSYMMRWTLSATSHTAQLNLLVGNDSASTSFQAN